jgi:uncharacterized membrane protein
MGQFLVNGKKRRSILVRRPTAEFLEVRSLMASFQGLGATNTYATAVSADGAVVVGNQTSNAPFVWTAAGIKTLADNSGDILPDTATGVSENGSAVLIVGTLQGGVEYGQQAVEWTSSGPVPLDLPAAASSSAANAISSDGSVIVGNLAIKGYDSGYLLEGTSSPVDIPVPNTVTGFASATANAVSLDGSVVAGTYTATGTGLDGSPFVWNDGQFLPITESGTSSGEATAVSGDGSVVVGDYIFPASGTQRAFSWTAQSGPTNLPFPAGVSDTPPMTATGVSNDGKAIVGYYGINGASTTATTLAFIWEQNTNQTQNLQDYLANELPASQLAGWTLTQATAITPDGNTIVGVGTYQGQEESWIVTGLNSTPTSPTPTSPTPTSPTPTSPTPTSPTPTSPIPTSPTPAPTKPPTSPGSGPHATRTRLTSQPRSSNFGRKVTFTATVQSLGHGGGTPIGVVTFYDGTIVVGERPLKRGTAKLSTSSLPLGPQTIRVVYAGSDDFQDSDSNSLTEKIRAGRSKGLGHSSVFLVDPSDSSPSKPTR